MSKIYTAVKKLTSIKRLDNSENGNPNYQLYFGNEVVRTEDDSMINYKISDTYLNEMCEIKYDYDEVDKAFLQDIKKVSGTTRNRI